MRKILLVSTLFMNVYLFGQSTMDKTVGEACDCITASTVEVVDYDSYLDLIIKCASPVIVGNTDALSRELGISEMDDMSAIEKIGEKVGERLVLECPRFSEITFKVLGDDPTLMEETLDEYDEDSDEMIEHGTVVSISKEIPCQITLKTDSDETLNFLWIEPIDIDEQYVSSPDKLKGKKVNIVYYYSEVYDPKNGTYQSKKVLIELTPN
jgi:hypothetical protein